MTKSKTRTITLTNHPPVRIREADWPVIAHGYFRDHDGREHECQANRWWRADVRVRRHADGRAIVYGTYEYFSVCAGERDLTAKAGVLVPKDADLVRAIRDVGLELAAATRRAGHDYSAHIAVAVQECIADLPPITLE